MRSLRSLKVLHFPLTRMLLWLLLTFLLSLLIRPVAAPLLRLGIPEPGKVLESLAAIAALLLLVRLVERRSPDEAGVGAAGLLRHTAVGFGVGAAIMALVIGCMALAGFYRVESVARGSLLWSTLGAGLWHYLWVAVFEEIALRGVFFRIMEEWLGSWWALGLSSLLFGLLHLGNPNSSLFAALCIAVEAGVLLGAAFMLTRNLWLAIGIHWAWNFFEGPVFGTAVSGGLGSTSLLWPAIQGAVLWTGGEFGPEAGLFALAIATSAGGIMLAAAARRGEIRYRKAA